MKALFSGLGWIPWAVSAGAAIALVGWLYLAGRADGVAAERPKTEFAADNGAARGLEAQGERESAGRADVAQDQARAARASVGRLQARAITSGDADVPIDQDRADRLRAHDRELCGIRPTLRGCPPLHGRSGAAAPADDAEGGRHGVRDPSAADRPADHGS